jgi:UDP-3-O-acyl-N-acetylglucosamine deacetylase
MTVPVIIGPTPTSVAAAVTVTSVTVTVEVMAGVGTIAPVMAAIVAATADCTVASISGSSISVGAVAGAAGSWVQLAVRARTTARHRARKILMINKILSPDPHSFVYPN